MKEIILTQNQIAIVDDEDYETLIQYKWQAIYTNHRYWYAVHRIGKSFAIRMHRMILDVPCHLMVDHIDGNGLNNQKSNLRSATNMQNQWNSKKRCNAYSSIYKGVYWHKPTQRWRAIMSINGKSCTIGNFKSEIEAALSYNQTAKKLRGEFASLNPI